MEPFQVADRAQPVCRHDPVSRQRYRNASLPRRRRSHRPEYRHLWPRFALLAHQPRVGALSRRGPRGAASARASVGRGCAPPALFAAQSTHRAVPQYLSLRLHHGLRHSRPGAGRGPASLRAAHSIAGELAEDTAAWKRGDRYEANEINALRWVFATLVESALLAYEGVFGALPWQDRERYYQETKTLAALFGIPAPSLPANLEDFASYIRAMCEAGDSSGALGVTADPRAMAHNLLAGAGSFVRPPRWYRALTASWLPARFREEFGLHFGPSEQLSADRAMRRIPAIYRRLPAPVRGTRRRLASPVAARDRSAG